MPKCSWCDEPAVDQLEVRPASYTKNHAGLKVMKTAALMMPTCNFHRGIVDRQPLFYTCGCTHVEGFDKCAFHGRAVKHVRRSVANH